MPTYDFTCSTCSSRFEALLPFGGKKRPPCPKCGSRKTEKLITPPTIHFKGTGFFKTDNCKKSSPEKKSEKTAPEPKKAEPTSPAPKAEEKKPPAKESD